MTSRRLNRSTFACAIVAAALLVAWLVVSWRYAEPVRPGASRSVDGASTSDTGVAGSPAEIGGDETWPGEAAPVRVPSSDFILLRVADERGDPIIGAEIEAIGDPQPNPPASDAAGVLRWPNSHIPADCRISHPSYLDSHHRVRGGGEVIVLRKRPRVTVNCVTTDAYPVEGVALRLEGPSEERTRQQSDRSGRVEWTNQQPGVYAITFDDGPWVPVAWHGASPSGRFELTSESLEVTMTVARASAAVVQIVGDRPILHYFSVTILNTLQTPGLADTLERIDQRIRAAFPSALTRVWAAPAGVEQVELIVYCEHSGWKHVQVPVRPYEPGISPHVVSIEPGQVALTASIKRIDGTGAQHLPIVAALTTQEHGYIQVLLDEEVTEVPCGQYRLRVHHAHLGDHSRVTPADIDLRNPGAIAAVEVSVDRPVLQVDLDVVRPDGNPWSGFLYGCDERGERVVTEFVDKGTVKGALLPAGIRLAWHCRDGKNAQFKAVTLPLESAGPGEACKITLEEAGR